MLRPVPAAANAPTEARAPGLEMQKPGGRPSIRGLWHAAPRNHGVAPDRPCNVVSSQSEAIAGKCESLALLGSEKDSRRSSSSRTIMNDSGSAQSGPSGRRDTRIADPLLMEIARFIRPGVLFSFALPFPRATVMINRRYIARWIADFTGTPRHVCVPKSPPPA
jgi:hypothetical protein